MVGDSIPHWASLERGRPEMSYFTQRGATWKTIRRVVETEVLLGTPPKAILLHLGGNDVTSCPQKRIFYNITREINYLREAFPEVILVWVDILPRLCWQPGSPLDKKRKRLNRFGAVEAGINGRHHRLSIDIESKDVGFFRQDGVHLNQLGLHFYNDAVKEFVNNLNLN